MKTSRLTIAFMLVSIILSPLFLSAQTGDVNRLLIDIPEPIGADSELPSPVPMVYDFIEAMMGGVFDVCLANFDVNTFLTILFDKQLQRINDSELRELYSYKVQSIRNELRFLSKVLHNVAPGARITYSDPRYHQKVQSKIVVKLFTRLGQFELVIYSRYLDNRWYVYDYVLNNQRLTKAYMDGLRGVRPNIYTQMLRPFYKDGRSYRPITNTEFDIGIKVPSDFEVREKISSSLLASVSAFNEQFLLHIQGAIYDRAQTLSEAAEAIKDSLMPFDPRLYEQWKGEVAGIEIGNVTFHFLKGNERLFNHMVIVPLGKKLVVMNFYHSSLELMKHMTNIREKILESLTLPQLEATGGLIAGEAADDFYGSKYFNEGQTAAKADSSDPWGGDEYWSNNESWDSWDNDSWDSSNDTWDSPSSEQYYYDEEPEIPHPTEEEAQNLLRPDSFYDYEDNDFYYDDIPPPPPPPSYDDYYYYDDDDGGDVMF